MMYSNKFVKWLICFAVVGLAACADQGSSSSSPDNNHNAGDDTPIFEHAKGSINGREWSYVQGRATPFRRNNKQYLEIRLWNSQYSNPCVEPVGSIYQVRMYVAFEKGSWRVDPLDPFSLIPTIIFSDFTSGKNPRNNLIADQGTVTLSSLTREGVSGWVQGRFTTSQDVGLTSVFGRFQVNLCTPLFGPY